jgi:dynein heavy chain
MKPERFIEAVQVVIAAYLGKEYLEHSPLNVEEAYNSSTHKTPVLFILSQGADPLEELRNFLAKRHLTDELVLLPLGKGQDKIADLTLNRALPACKTIWIVMQNCHLAKTYLSHLEKRLEEIPEEPKLPFRLWLTSMPTNNFPTTLLQHSIKLAHERPKGISKSMTEMYRKLDKDKFEVKEITRKLLFNLTMFHALIQEREKYGLLGWSYPYEFSYYDYEVATKQLLTFVEHSEEIQWNALEYAVVDLVYGGHIIDSFDLKRLKVIYSDLFNEEALKDDYKLCGNTEYKLSVNLKTKEEYIKHLKALPLNDKPQVFGLSHSANTAYLMNNTNQLFTKLTTLNSTTTKISKEDQEQIVSKMNELLETLPKEFDIEECSKVYPEEGTKYENAVLIQELKKYNVLLRIVKESLSDLQKALKGQSLMVPSVEEVMISLLNGQVPEMWRAYSYPTTETSLLWFRNLKARIEFFREWVGKGSVESYWISAFFYPSSFLTSILQNYSRTTATPIDTLTIDYTIPSQDITEGYLIHGLTIEGAVWDADKNCLGEGIRAEMPKVWARPVADIPTDRHTFECPVYYEKKKQGAVDIKTLIMTVNLPLDSEDTKEKWIKRGVYMTI